jgi:hypothetical protein
MDTDENPPVSVGGHIQWQNLPTWGKWAGGAVAGFMLTVWPAWQHIRTTRVQEDAIVAKQKAVEAASGVAQDKAEVDLGWKAMIPRLTALEAKEHAREVKEAQTQKRTRRTSPIVVPPAPKPLPSTLKALQEQVQKGPSVSPLPTPDGGT